MGMKLLGHTLVALVVLTVGCASRSVPTEAPEKETASLPHEVDQVVSEHAQEGAQASTGDSAFDASDPRVVGDYVTFAFTGAYRKAPLKLTQRVVARTGDQITIDFTFVDAKKTDTLRLTSSTGSASRGEILEVLRLAADGSSKPATRAEFEAKIADTAAVTDQNEALIDERPTTVRVGTSELLAKTSTYKVRIGDKSATLETTASEGFAWGDLGGRITTADGKLFFRAELVDAGGPASRSASLK